MQTSSQKQGNQGGSAASGWESTVTALFGDQLLAVLLVTVLSVVLTSIWFLARLALMVIRMVLPGRERSVQIAIGIASGAALYLTAGIPAPDEGPTVMGLRATLIALQLVSLLPSRWFSPLVRQEGH